MTEKLTRPKIMDVGDIVAEYLEAHGYDGLCNIDAECGCTLDDWIPCQCLSENCLPGWKAPCPCGDHDWHISTEHPQDANCESDKMSKPCDKKAKA